MALIILECLVVLVGIASSAPIYPVPLNYVALSSIPENIYNQVQDTKSGEYAFAYAGGPVAREEARTSDGVTRGAYSYVDAHGIVQSYRYVADDDGFRVVGTNIPMELPSNRQPQLRDVNVEAIDAENLPEKSMKIGSSRIKRSAIHEDIPVKTVIDGLQAASVPAATSSQSRVQIHRSFKAEVRNPIKTIPSESVAIVSAIPLAVKSGVEAIHLANVASVPTATSSQSRYQIHNGARTEFHEPVEAFPIETVAREAFLATLPVTIAASSPTSTSIQSRDQIRTSLKTELYEPVEAIPIETVTALPGTPVAVSAAVKSIETIPATPETKITDHEPQVAVRSTAAQSTAAPSTAAQSTTAQSAAAQSTAAQSTAAQSTAAQPIAAQSTAAQSTAAQSTAVQSTGAQSTAAQSTATQSTASQFTAVPAYAEASTSDQRHIRLHNGANFELGGLPQASGHELVEFQSAIGLQAANEFSHPLLARHRIGVGLGVVPSPFVAYHNYDTALFVQA